MTRRNLHIKIIWLMQNNAPGEDRTHNLRISLADQALLYKYDALTDCATGAAFATPKYCF
ncbi:hypothetical protein T10_7984 [Trichinella papuae]|uniref:Uncharacterized protein n=1 Tax=Trichinella papuae TaxID=268474 RepID=A0A0V1N0D3_9BILA|nr:hypothetical protein T10_7984 [Trichinella papuae]